jgi:molybdenum cofactor guanylyltransferase
MTTPICGLVLAGGQGRRMGGIDKGLAPFHGRPLVAHVVERLRPQVERLLISANRNIEAYTAFGEVVTDRVADFAGPLAGLDAGLHACAAPLLVTVPCDAPFLPADLVARLAAARAAADADVAIARTGTQVHPVLPS